MTHIDDETLSVLAIVSGAASPDTGSWGAGVLTPDEASHLAACAHCRSELAAIRRVVALGRASDGLELSRPDPMVWQRIAEELGLDHDAAAPVHPAPRASGAARPLSIDLAAPGRGPRRPSRPDRSARGRAVWIPVAAAALVVGAAGGLLGGGAFRAPAPTQSSTAVGSEVIVSRAALDAFPGWTGARGTATLERTPGGRLTLVVDLDTRSESGSGSGSESGSGAGSPLREVWLMRPDLSGLVSVGFLDGDRGRFVVPSGVDPGDYPLVDVSAEADDGNPQHSGDSIVRGTLEPGRP